MAVFLLVSALETARPDVLVGLERDTGGVPQIVHKALNCVINPVLVKSPPILLQVVQSWEDRVLVFFERGKICVFNLYFSAEPDDNANECTGQHKLKDRAHQAAAPNDQIFATQSTEVATGARALLSFGRWHSLW